MIFGENNNYLSIFQRMVIICPIFNNILLFKYFNYLELHEKQLISLFYPIQNHFRQIIYIHIYKLKLIVFYLTKLII